MKKITLILLSFISTYIAAQHCPFDNKGLIVVNVVMENEHLNQLKVLHPILTYVDNNNKKVRIPFKLNLIETNYYLWNKNKYNVENLHFDFAKDYFVASVSISDCKDIAIHLEDEKGTVIVAKRPVKKESIYDLHQNYGHNWFEFGTKNTIPKPKNKFDKLITITTHNVKTVKTLVFKEKSNFYHLYKYKNRIIFDNQQDLDQVFTTYVPENKKIDFSKSIVFYQVFRSDCHMKVKVFKYINDKEKTVTIKSLVLYGGCRASGTRVRLSIINKPKDYKLIFEDIKVEDTVYSSYYWLKY